MLKTIYETGYDLHVANYVAYLHTDKKLYEDEAHKTQAKKADVEKAFKLGRLIIMGADKTYLHRRRCRPGLKARRSGRGSARPDGAVLNDSKWSEMQ